jgi:Ca2+-binding RTX toxin-like protein
MLEFAVDGSHTGGLLLDLGPGEDVLEAKVHNARLTFSSLYSTLTYGQGGDDEINVVADAAGTLTTGVATNTVHGGEGCDRITAVARTEFLGGRTSASNFLYGDAGDDVFDATARAPSNLAEWASNTIEGGPGKDRMHAFCLTDSNAYSPVGLNELSGNEGDDELVAVHSTDGENGRTDVTSILDGGQGNDSLLSESRALGWSSFAMQRLDGGPGHDSLTARLDSWAIFVDGLDVSNILSGGPGSDYLEAWLAANCGGGEPCIVSSSRRAENHLDGGTGSDELLATVAPDSDGSSFLAGGDGHDSLTVVGGAENVLDGGLGNDDLVAGAGNDWLIGGPGADTFHLDLSSDQGDDTIADFDRRRDALSFAGIDDSGAPGLVDDLDAVSAFTDLGPGADVIVDFAPGSRIVFVGLGTGDTTSWASLLHPRRAS